MLNNLCDFLNLISTKKFKTTPELKDVFAMGTPDRKSGSGFKPTFIQWVIPLSYSINQH